MYEHASVPRFARVPLKRFDHNPARTALAPRQLGVAPSTEPRLSGTMASTFRARKPMVARELRAAGEGPEDKAGGPEK